MKRVSFVLVAVALLVAPLGAQQTTTQGSGQGSGQGSAQGSGQGQQGRTTTVTQQAQQGLGSLSQLDNVRLELTITDQSAAGQPVKKVVTLLLAERGMGRVRSGGEVYRAGTDEAPGSQYLRVTLNADANISTIDGDRIRTHITVEYMPVAQGPHRMNMLNQTVDVILTNGKPTLIVESADPTSDRKVVLHATATIVR